MAVPSRLLDEQQRRSEKFCKLLAELKSEMISLSDSIRHQLESVLARRLESVAVDGDDVGHTTWIKHRIETGNRLLFIEKLALYPTRVAFSCRELNRQL